MTFDELVKAFPRKGKNRAATGNIPIAYFDANEAAIRAAMRLEARKRGMKIWAAYRGARVSNKLSVSFAGEKGIPSQTRRCDAVAVKMYFLPR